MDEENPFSTRAVPSQSESETPIYVSSDNASGVIPYKNPKALIAYYLGILSGLPFVGLPIGIAAFVLGIQGLKNRKKDPTVKGSVHAWIGIGCGGFFALLWFLILLLMMVVGIGNLIAS